MTALVPHRVQTGIFLKAAVTSMVFQHAGQDSDIFWLGDDIKFSADDDEEVAPSGPGSIGKLLASMLKGEDAQVLLQQVPLAACLLRLRDWPTLSKPSRIAWDICRDVICPRQIIGLSMVPSVLRYHHMLSHFLQSSWASLNDHVKHWQT